MVRVNGKEYSVSQLDTKHSIIDRVSVELDTLSKYLYFPNGFPENLNTDENIEVYDLLKKIIKNAKSNKNFVEFIEKYRNKIPKNLDIKKDVLPIWLVYNEKLEQLYKLNKETLSQDYKYLVDNEYFNTTDEMERYYANNRLLIKEMLERDKKILKDRVTNLEKQEEQFNTIEGAVYTELKTEQLNLELNLELKDITILEIFNNIILNEAVPYASCKGYYKILKDFVPSEEWTESPDDYLLLKMYKKPTVESLNYKEYTNIEIRVEGELGNEKVTVNMKLITQSGYLSQEKFIERFISIFPSNIVYKNVVETEVIGVFYYPENTIYSYAFADLVLNDTLFSSLLVINESNRASKHKTESGQPQLRLIFNHPSTGRITASVTQQFVNYSDIEMKGQNHEIFEENSPYIRVRVKGQDQKSIDVFKEIFSKLLEIYSEKVDSIIEIYRKYISDFGEIIQTVKKQKKKRLKDLGGGFVSNYSRTCSLERQPTQIKKNEVQKYLDMGKQVMKFPRDKPESGETYPSDGVGQHYYVCLNERYKFPGLQKNKLPENRDEYPYLPCCFSYNKINSSNWKNYYEGIETKDVSKKQQDLITTNKILKPNQFGDLSKDLEVFFNNLDNNINYKYKRIGVHRTHSSFLNAVMLGLHDETDILEWDENEVMANILQIRESLAKDENVAVARQCFYDSTTDYIKKLILDFDTYLDPRKYIQLLENFFNCNIFIFNETEMVLPRYLQSLYKYRNKGNCVFIYEHMGSESDHATYPQCELIIRWYTKKSSETQYYFPMKQEISQKINKIFTMLHKSYVLENVIKDTNFSLPDSVTILGQKIDSYGKTRQLLIKYNKTNFTLFTSPIPPLRVIEQPNLKIYNANIDDVLSLFEKLNITIKSQKMVDGMTREVITNIGNVEIIIPLQDGVVLNDVPSNNTTITYYDTSESEIQIYNYNKKLARYLTEYSLWLFSKYLQIKNIDVITDKVLAKFAKKYTQIIKGYKYGNISKTFSTNSSVIVDNKLVFNSLEMLKRMMYVIKLFSLRNLSKLLEYHTYTVIRNYYVDITDFDKHPREIILYGDDIIDKWIQESKFSYILQTGVATGRRTPYFFKNKLIENKVFLAQNVTTIPRAMDIAITWQKRGYNIGNYADNTSIHSFYLYSYVNENNITLYKINRSEETLPQKIRIIGYKLSGTPFYTVLLEL